MTIYLAWYFGLGIIALVLLFRLTKAESDAGNLGISYPNEKSWWKKTLIPVVSYSLLLLLWPALIVWKVKEAIFPHKANTVPEPKEFAVEHEHLLQQVTVEEIERAAMISDPLCAVPNLPFGHLNSAWLRFKENLDAEDALWTFAAHHTDNWGSKEYKEGYVIVRADSIAPYFLTYRKFVNG